MSTSHLVHRFPRAHVDPITTPATATRVLAAAVHRPLRAETIALLLDHERRGLGIVVVSGTTEPEAAVEVVEFLATSGTREGTLGSIVLATVRPRGAAVATDDGRTSSTASDLDRWMEMSDLAEDAGVELIEWFVVGPAGVVCPRDALGEPPRW